MSGAIPQIWLAFAGKGNLIWSTFFRLLVQKQDFFPFVFIIVPLPDYCGNKSLKTPWRKFPKFDTYVHLDPKMDCFDYGNLGSSVKATLTY